jgi:hypothetical protein
MECALFIGSDDSKKAVRAFTKIILKKNGIVRICLSKLAYSQKRFYCLFVIYVLREDVFYQIKVLHFYFCVIKL